jgi:hypothetical protein
MKAWIRYVRSRSRGNQPGTSTRMSYDPYTRQVVKRAVGPALDFLEWIAKISSTIPKGNVSQFTEADWVKLWLPRGGVTRKALKTGAVEFCALAKVAREMLKVDLFSRR